MAYTSMPAEGAIGFNWARSIGILGSQKLVEMLSGEIFLVDANVDVPTGRWIAYRFHKTLPVSLPGIADAPFRISWCRDLDEVEFQGLTQTIVRLNQASQNMVAWRRQLSAAEWQTMQAGSQAVVSGAVAACSIGSTLACIATGGLFAIPLGIAAVSGMACASSVSAMEASARAGNALVERINAEYKVLYRLGQDLQLPELAVHSTPQIASACTQVSEVFDWMRGTIWWNQKGIDSYLSSNLKFGNS